VAETRALQGAAADRAGCVVSFPGTPAQQLHTDGAPLTPAPDPSPYPHPLTLPLPLPLALTLTLTLTLTLSP
jgi:hypothetical protein